MDRIEQALNEHKALVKAYARETFYGEVEDIDKALAAVESSARDIAALVAAHEREQIAAHYGAQPHVEHFGSNIADEIRART